VSDSEGGMMNTKTVGSINLGKLRKLVPKSMQGELQTPINTSVLSPFAKVFTPKMSLVKPKGSRVDGLRECTNESTPTSQMWLPGAVE